MKKSSRKSRWSAKAATQWYELQPWPIGCNYTPRTAINQIETWRKASFDPKTVRQELTWASKLGMNSIRIFLHELAWQEDPQGFMKRLDKVLGIANSLGMGAMIVFFDSVWHPFPRAGKQADPEPGVHNSGWVQSPGVSVLRDERSFDRLKPYVKGVVSHFADDPRVTVWDVWNEPDNSNGTSYGPRDAGAEKVEMVMKYLPRVFDWVRSAKPSQPLTCGVWAGDWASPQTLKPHEALQLELSDVISFHCYGGPDDLERRIKQLQQYDRPLLCTEFMSRGSGSTFAGSLPILKANRVGAYCWGLVAGKTQTNYPWDSWQRPYTAEPKPWFHDVFRGDGSPYDRRETKFIQLMSG